MHRPVVTTAEQYQIGQRRWPAMRPVLDVMRLNEPEPAPGEAAHLIAVQ